MGKRGNGGEGDQESTRISCPLKGQAGLCDFSMWGAYLVQRRLRRSDPFVRFACTWGDMFDHRHVALDNVHGYLFFSHAFLHVFWENVLDLFICRVFPASFLTLSFLWVFYSLFGGSCASCLVWRRGRLELK